MEELTAYILAGGKSSRMGMTKGLCKLDNSYFVERIIKQISVFTDNIFLNTSLDDYNFLEIEKVEDIYKDKGPVGGIYSVLKHSKTKYNLIFSCDVPLINSNLIEVLINDNSDNDVVQLATKDRNMPLIAKYHKRVELFFLNKINNNELRLNKVLKELKVKTIIVSENEEYLLQNINNIDELKQIKNEN